MMDYRELLRRYMEHVVKCEGTTYLVPLNNYGVKFTKEELAELLKIDQQVCGTSSPGSLW